jgi:hypothetical protein
MKTYDINIDYFGDINQCQQLLSLYRKDPVTSLSLLSQPGTKNNKTEFFIPKLNLKKRFRHRNRIICIILKVR